MMQPAHGYGPASSDLSLEAGGCAIGVEVRLQAQAAQRQQLRLRIAFQRKLPRLADRYFRSRPSSDMAERAHAIHRVRDLPLISTQLLRTLCLLACTTAGVIWLDPASAFLALATALASVALPLAARKALALFVYLAVEAGAHPREKLQAIFWPESDPSSAHGYYQPPGRR